jgi:hypothetical protein
MRVILIIVAIVPFVTLLGSEPAGAIPACPASTTSDFIGRQHYDSSDGIVAGIRAPILLRKNSNLCSPDADQSFVSPWIGIQSETNSSLGQIGWDHEPATYGGFCKFWANGLGTPHDYVCGFDDSTTNYFQVLEFPGGTGPDYYEMFDCHGDSTYNSSNCDIKGSQNAWASSDAAALTETNYGGSACTDQIGGSSGNPVTFGNSTDSIQIMNTMFGSWLPWNLEISTTPTCGHYKTSYTNTGSTSLLSNWDNRNVS